MWDSSARSRGSSRKHCAGLGQLRPRRLPFFLAVDRCASSSAVFVCQDGRQTARLFFYGGGNQFWIELACGEDQRRRPRRPAPTTAQSRRGPRTHSAVCCPVDVMIWFLPEMSCRNAARTHTGVFLGSRPQTHILLQLSYTAHLILAPRTEAKKGWAAF